MHPGRAVTEPGDLNPLALTVDAVLDHAVNNGWSAWRSAAGSRPSETVAKWMVRRAPEIGDAAEASELVARLIGDGSPEERAMTAAELAEMLEDEDPLFATVLWEAVQEAGYESSDAEWLFEGAARLAALEEEYGDPLTAAEFLIDFLNWRRVHNHASEPEAVLTAFDEIIRLAGLDGAPAATAQFTWEQARFMHTVENEDQSAQEGDWTNGGAPYAAWDSQ